MKKLGLILFLTGMLQNGFSQTKNFIDQPYLETSVEVDTLVTPNRIHLGIRLMESDSKGRISLEILEQQMGEKLSALGIDLDKQLTVSDLGSEFHKYFLRKEDIVKEKAFELVLYDAGTTARVLYELEKAGISNIQLLKTDYEDMESLKDILRVRGIQKTKRQGTMMANALGQSLGSALHITDRGFSVYNKSMERGAVLSMSDENQEQYVPLPAEFDKIRIQVTVSAKFKLE
ncbi:SIMPL domain-containing protein [Robiginitalea sp.]|uniref:SIMPL domain-containing protein n=1 Tax=Robiginitalea sp. TaxID=1902411 RepID=UPI003C4BB244